MKLFKTLLLACCCAFLALSLSACSGSNNDETNTKPATPVTLGDLRLSIYDYEYVVDTKGEGCIAIYMKATNTGEHSRSVMGSYTVKRFQDGTGTLKVGVAYNGAGNIINTAGNQIAPGETRDIAMCFKLQGVGPVTVIFGNEELGVPETTLTFTVTKPSSNS